MTQTPRRADGTLMSPGGDAGPSSPPPVGGEEKRGLLDTLFSPVFTLFGSRTDGSDAGAADAAAAEEAARATAAALAASSAAAAALAQQQQQQQQQPPPSTVAAQQRAARRQAADEECDEFDP